MALCDPNRDKLIPLRGAASDLMHNERTAVHFLRGITEIIYMCQISLLMATEKSKYDSMTQYQIRGFLKMTHHSII